ncbi:MAG TPA: HutD family protein [Pararobbsia sp.]|jgi:environmental stress-induced protein Ves|nr:HutD family protein [Pararobbsia sp.]
MRNASTIVTFEKISAASRRPVPWKNRGGVTREIAMQAPAHPAVPDEFDWRVSVAEIDQPGPFSTFERVDRILVMTRGEQMVLRHGDALERLACWQPFEFAGETPVTAHLPTGPTRDFNLMVRRDYGRGVVHVYHASQQLAIATGVALFYCAAGAFAIGAVGDDDPPVMLEEGDTLRVDLDARMVFELRPAVANSTLIDARIEPGAAQSRG